jgi:ankyrin repeat protein
MCILKDIEDKLKNLRKHKRFEVIKEFCEDDRTNYQYSYTGSTVLMWASLNGHIQIVKTLLKSGLDNVHTDPNIKNIDGIDALYCSTIYWHENNAHIKIPKMLTRHIILIPFMNYRFKKINKDIIRETKKWIH